MSVSIVSVALDRKEVQKIKQIARRRGENQSSFIRRCILQEMAKLGYLSDQELKALGIDQEKVIQ